METKNNLVDAEFYSKQNAKTFKDERWREELLPEHLFTFEKFAGALNRKYGYAEKTILWINTPLERSNRMLKKAKSNLYCVLFKYHDVKDNQGYGTNKHDG